MEPTEEEKIKEAVLDILNSSDMTKVTEAMIRKTASEKLEMDLSARDRKLFVRGVVETYLAEQAEKNAEQEEVELDREKQEEEEEEGDGKRKRGDKEYDDEGDLIMCRLSDKRRVTIQDFRGKTLVSMREYYKRDGKELPTAKGISLTAEQWATFKKNVPAIEKAIKKMETRLS